MEARHRKYQNGAEKRITCTLKLPSAEFFTASRKSSSRHVSVDIRMTLSKNHDRYAVNVHSKLDDNARPHPIWMLCSEPAARLTETRPRPLSASSSKSLLRSVSLITDAFAVFSPSQLSV